MSFKSHHKISVSERPKYFLPQSGQFNCYTLLVRYVISEPVIFFSSFLCSRAGLTKSCKGACPNCL
jgi:hypothetical protein